MIVICGRAKVEFCTNRHYIDWCKTEHGLIYKSSMLFLAIFHSAV